MSHTQSGALPPHHQCYLVQTMVFWRQHLQTLIASQALQEYNHSRYAHIILYDIPRDVLAKFGSSNFRKRECEDALMAHCIRGLRKGAYTGSNI